MQTLHGLHPPAGNENAVQKAVLLLLFVARTHDMRSADMFATNQPAPYGLKICMDATCTINII